MKECEQEMSIEIGRERIPSRFLAARAEPDTGLDLTN